LSWCFMKFTVAFWGSKNKSYMEEIVHALLSYLKGREKFDPLFVWSGKSCEATGFEDGAYVSWGKPLKKVFKTWPEYDVKNTIIIDHKGFRIGYNDPGNVLITMAFYIHTLEKLEDDGSYLEASMWPVLEAFAASSAVSYNTESDIVDTGAGEGTCGP
jgi:hypothetical protein